MAGALPAVGAGSGASWGAVVGPAAARFGCALRAAFGASTATAAAEDSALVATVDAFSGTGNAARGTTGSVALEAVVAVVASDDGAVAKGVSELEVSGIGARVVSGLGWTGSGARTASPLGLIGARVVVVVVVASVTAAAASLCSSLGLRAS